MKTGKVLITGASRGLGAALAREMARRGFHVIAGVRNPANAEGLLRDVEGLAGSIELQQMDVAALADYRPPSDLLVLINNAGYRGPYLPAEETATEEWLKTFQTNFFGLAELTRRAIPVLRINGGGVICNIGSIGAFMPMPFYATYRASKAALAAFSECLSMELAPFGIRVIEVPVGGIDTDMLRTSIAHRPPDAIAFEAYRPMAQHPAAMPVQGKLQAITPAQAAINIADQLFIEGALRRACDPNGISGLQYLDDSSAEQRLQAAMQKFDLGRT